MKRHLPRLLLASLVVALAGCAHRDAQSYEEAGGAPLGIIDCYDSWDIYTTGDGPCTGFVYRDYEQYPGLELITRRQVTLTGDRQHDTRVVTRPGFGQSSPDFASSADSSSTFSTSGGNSSSSSSAPVPRMDPAPVNAPAGPVVVSRPH